MKERFILGLFLPSFDAKLILGLFLLSFDAKLNFGEENIVSYTYCKLCVQKKKKQVDPFFTELNRECTVSIIRQ